jgi:hypothetical protein
MPGQGFSSHPDCGVWVGNPIAFLGFFEIRPRLHRAHVHTEPCRVGCCTPGYPRPNPSRQHLHHFSTSKANSHEGTKMRLGTILANAKAPNIVSVFFPPRNASSPRTEPPYPLPRQRLACSITFLAIGSTPAKQISAIVFYDPVQSPF